MGGDDSDSFRSFNDSDFSKDDPVNKVKFDVDPIEEEGLSGTSGSFKEKPKVSPLKMAEKVLLNHLKMRNVIQFEKITTPTKADSPSKSLFRKSSRKVILAKDSFSSIHTSVDTEGSQINKHYKLDSDLSSSFKSDSISSTESENTLRKKNSSDIR